MPNLFRFPGQREGEEVLMLIYKHPIVYVKIVMAFVLVIVLPAFLFLMFWFMAYPLADFFYRGVTVGLIISMCVLYGILFICIRWIDEEFDIFILTSDRLIDVTQVTFLKRTVTSTPLEQIQDTTGEISGFLPTILQYGNLTVQTAAGDASDFFIDHIPDPDGIARTILDWAHKKRMGQSMDVCDNTND